MSIFLDESSGDKYVYVTVYYFTYNIDEDNQNLIVFDREEHVPDEMKDQAKKLRARFIKPDFTTANELAKESIAHTSDGKIYQSPPLYKENTLRTMLKRIETDTHSIDISDENYGNINIALADGIFEAFNRIYLNPNLTLDELREKMT